jgi:putative addiction module CopG family antidote
MNIVLSPEAQKLLEQKLRSGEYQSADDVVHAALTALDELQTHALDEATLEPIHSKTPMATPER